MIFLFSNNGFYVHKRAYSGVSDRTILGEYCTAYLPFQSSSTNLDIRSILKALPAHCRHILYAYTVNFFQPVKYVLAKRLIKIRITHLLCNRGRNRVCFLDLLLMNFKWFPNFYITSKNYTSVCRIMMHNRFRD